MTLAKLGQMTSKSVDKKTKAGMKLANMLGRQRSSRVSTSELRENSSAIVSRVAIGHERIILTRNRKPVAVLLPIADFNALRLKDT
jgi:prevent-host-death family protein